MNLYMHIHFNTLFRYNINEIVWLEIKVYFYNKYFMIFNFQGEYCSFFLIHVQRFDTFSKKWVYALMSSLIYLYSLKTDLSSFCPANITRKYNLFRPP